VRIDELEAAEKNDQEQSEAVNTGRTAGVFEKTGVTVG